MKFRIIPVNGGWQVQIRDFFIWHDHAWYADAESASREISKWL